MTYFPLEISRSGRYVAGEVIVPRPIEAASRPALWTPHGRAGWEDDVEMDKDEKAWAVVQLDVSRRYHEMVASLVKQGKLTLRPGLPGFGQLPAAVTSWQLDGLHYSRAMALIEPLAVIPQALWNRLDRAGSAAQVLELIEPVAVLPQRIWDELDELVAREKERSH